MIANNSMFPWMQSGPFATGPTPWQQPPAATDMKKLREIHRARVQAWRDWLLSSGLANLDLDETNKNGHESGEDKSNGIPESKPASKEHSDPRQDWFDHMQRMRIFGPTVSWLDEEVPDLVFEDGSFSSEARDRGRRVKTAGEDKKCMFSVDVLILALFALCYIMRQTNWRNRISRLALSKPIHRLAGGEKRQHGVDSPASNRHRPMHFSNSSSMVFNQVVFTSLIGVPFQSSNL